MIHRCTDTTSRLYVGVDVGKKVLDVSTTGLRLTVPNTKEGCASLLRSTRRLKKRLHFICEPTGYYSDTLILFLQAKRCRLSVISSYHVRQFAKATGRIAKSDRIDAEMLADAGRTLRPKPSPKIERSAYRLRAIMRRRWQLTVCLRVQNQQKPEVEHSGLNATCDAVIAALEEQIAALDVLAERTIDRSPRLNAIHQAISSVKCMGTRSAAYVLAELPALGTFNRKQVAALAGLAPMHRESGDDVGRRPIKGGRLGVRRALFMPALVAIRFNPVLRDFYKQLRDRGKRGRVAHVAVMRKLLIHINSVARKSLETLSKRAPHLGNQST